MRAAWFIGKFELLLNCTKYPIYSPKSRTPQYPQNVGGHCKATPKQKDKTKTDINENYEIYSNKNQKLFWWWKMS